jgi:hypothetical protein
VIWPSSFCICWRPSPDWPVRAARVPVVAESVLVKQQLLILNRSRRRSASLRLSDRTIAGLCAVLMRPRLCMANSKNLEHCVQLSRS